MKKFLLLLFLFLLFSAPAFAEPQITTLQTSESSPPAQTVEQTAFRNELSLVSRKSLMLGNDMISRIKKINDSYRLTAEAVRLLADRGDIQAALPLLRNAVRDYDGNRLAYLLLGYAYEKLGNQKEAAGSYEEFYRNSLTLVPVETKLIGPSSLQVFRSYVEARFKTWNISLPRPKVSLDLQKMRSLVMLESSEYGQRINLVLPFTLIGGLIFLALARAWQMELFPGAWYFLISLYLLTVLGYAIWAAHFFLGLPFFISLETELKIFLCSGITGIILIYAGFCFIKDYREINSEGAARCSHCRKVISRLDAQCPACGRRQT